LSDFTDILNLQTYWVFLTVTVVTASILRCKLRTIGFVSPFKDVGYITAIWTCLNATFALCAFLANQSPGTVSLALDNLELFSLTPQHAIFVAMVAVIVTAALGLFYYLNLVGYKPTFSVGIEKQPPTHLINIVEKYLGDRRDEKRALADATQPDLSDTNVAGNDDNPENEAA